MDNELIKLITIIAIPTVTIVASNMALFLHLSKKIDNLNQRIDGVSDSLNQKIDNLNNRITKLEIEIVKLQHRFDASEGKQTNIEKQLAEIKNETTKQNEITTNRFIKMETDNKNYIKELTNKVLEVLPKSVL